MRPRDLSQFWTEPIFQVTNDYSTQFNFPNFPPLEENMTSLRSDEVAAEWLNSYQKIINDWRSSRGLTSHYETSESSETCEVSEENSEYARESENELSTESTLSSSSEEEYYLQPPAKKL